jgi:hypothetical protein
MRRIIEKRKDFSMPANITLADVAATVVIINRDKFED